MQCTVSTDYSYTFLGNVLILGLSALTRIYAINLAAINALKYFTAINATLFTSGVR